MANIVRLKNQAQSEFQKVFQKLCHTKSSWSVWTDFIYLAAISIANNCEKYGKVHDERENEYTKIIKEYTDDEKKLFPKLLEIVADDLEREPAQDFLGELFMGLGMGSHWKGQFFTPYSACQMMADVLINENYILQKIEKRSWIGINDPACGAGALLIAARNALASKNISLGNTLFVAQDIDRMTALMCYIQLSILGCAGYVVVADTLEHPLTGNFLLPNVNERQELWVTPMLYSEFLSGRIACNYLAGTYDVILANPPFGIRPQAAGNVSEIRDFIPTSDNQVNFLQHIMSIVKTDGRVGVVLPDNVLTDGGATVKVREKLLKEFNLHTILRLPTGIFYANGVKTNVLFFDKSGPTQDIWVYDYRTGIKHTLATKPMKREDLDDFVACYCSGHQQDRTPTYTEENPNGRWRRFTAEEVYGRDQLKLDFKWMDLSEKDDRSLAELLQDIKEKSVHIANAVAELEKLIGEIDE